jgi:molybdopterin-containing oxidoreductase family membrane subunit
MLSGTYAWLFWLSVGLLIISFGLLFVQFTRSKYSILLTVLAGVMVNVAAVAARFLIVVPSQTHGRLLPYEAGTYSPTWVEYGVVVGLLAFGALAIILFFKVFPIMEVEPKDADAGRLQEEANHA